MTINAASVLEREVDDLVEISIALSRDASTSRSALGPDRIEQLGMVASRLGPIIRRLHGAGSQYEENLQRVVKNAAFTSMHSNHFEHVSELAGIAKGLQRDIKSGVLRDIRKLLQAEVFADFLDMAEHLLNESYKDAAAVLLGAVLEDSLRKIAQGEGIPITGPTGRSLTIDPLNVAIGKAKLYGPLVQKQVTTWAHLRNDAAHGNFGKYDAAHVQQMLLFVQKFCADHLQ